MQWLPMIHGILHGRWQSWVYEQVRQHVPVLLEEVLKELQCNRPGLYVDCTIGAGGHALGILSSSPGNRVIGIDWDDNSLDTARENLKGFGDRVIYIREDYSSIGTILDNMNISEVDGFLFDLGLSSMHLDSPERGFSIRQDSPLDMRMDRRKETTAAELVNHLEAGELIHIIKEFGEEKWAKRIVTAIVRERSKGNITTTGQLAEIVCSAIPYSSRPDRIHPATKTFQALRIAVNSELDHIDKAIRDAIMHLKRGCRICVISFHSLEDRIIKHTFRNMEKGCICPPRIPYCICGLKKEITVLTRKPIRPSSTEIINNPRSGSAKLRAAERV